MSSYISENIRHIVATCAEYLCEYCLIHEDDAFFGCEVDHIISIKHGGLAKLDNLAYACAFCNRHKGSDVGSILQQINVFMRFFNPRKDQWSDHFQLRGFIIELITQIGIVTARILNFNCDDRILERKALITVGRYPSESAKVRMKI